MATEPTKAMQKPDEDAATSGVDGAARTREAEPVETEEAEPGRDGTAKGDPMSDLELLVLGTIPETSSTAGTLALAFDARRTRAAVLRAYLAERPELRAQLAAHIDEERSRPAESSAEHRKQLALLRLEITTAAEGDWLRQRVPEAVAAQLNELGRYLDSQGMTADARRLVNLLARR